MEKPKLFDINEVVWKEGARPDIPRTAIFQGSEHMTIQYFELPSKSQGPPHIHEEEQIVCVLQGRIEVWVDGVSYEAGPGCIVLIPSNVEHYGSNPGRQTAVTLEIFTPKRTDHKQSEKNIDLGHKNWNQV